MKESPQCKKCISLGRNLADYRCSHYLGRVLDPYLVNREYGDITVYDPRAIETGAQYSSAELYYFFCAHRYGSGGVCPDHYKSPETKKVGDAWCRIFKPTPEEKDAFGLYDHAYVHLIGTVDNSLHLVYDAA